MGNPLFAAGGELSGNGEAAFLAELQARAEAESKQLENNVKAVRKSRRFSQVHSVDLSQVTPFALHVRTGLSIGLEADQLHVPGQALARLGHVTAGLISRPGDLC